MAANGFDVSELTKFEEKLVKLANDTMKKESKGFIRKEAKKLNAQNKKTYKALMIDVEGAGTGNLFQSFKTGKAYQFDGSWSARAYNSAPHAHLIEYGHMWTPHDTVAKGQKVKQTGEEHFIPGYQFMEKARRIFKSQYYADVEKFIDEMLDKGL